MKEMVTTVGNNALVLNTAERSLGEEVSVIENSAQGVIVYDDASYAAAAEITKKIKQMQKKVKDYWEPLRVSAKRTYDDVLGKKKAMIEPLDEAEKIIKGKMAGFVKQKEMERRAQEEALRRAAQAEADRKLEEAVKLEANADTEKAEAAMAEAEVYDDAASGVVVVSSTPKVDGVSTSKTWKITGIDITKVPVTFNGVQLLKVDEKEVMRLIRATKGQIQIPGIEYTQDISVSIRS